MIPRLAALSIAEINARICSVLGFLSERTVFCIVRRRVTTARLRSDRLTVWRARLAADFVFAIVNQKMMDLHARQRVTIVNPSGFPGVDSPPGPANGVTVQARATTVYSIPASLFASARQAPHPFAFVRLRAYRRKPKQKVSRRGSEVLGWQRR